MTIKTYALLSQIHEYARKQLEQLEHAPHKRDKLTYKEKEYNAEIRGQVRAWEHVLHVTWMTDEQQELIDLGHSPEDAANIIKEQKDNEQSPRSDMRATTANMQHTLDKYADARLHTIGALNSLTQSLWDSGAMTQELNEAIKTICEYEDTTHDSVLSIYAAYTAQLKENQ